MKESVVFFGSGPVAAESLRLLQQHLEVEAVITKPSTVEQMKAVAGDTTIYSVSNKRELDNLIEARSFDSQLAVLIDFGIIVSQAVIDSFKLGIINSHFSVLPEWRGADPISFAILSGQQTTGVSLMLLTAGMDEGPLLIYDEISLNGTETTPDLTGKLIKLSDTLLKKEVPKYFRSEITPVPQSTTERAESYSRKLTKSDGNIDWTKSAQQIEREIRAFIEWPKSSTTLAGKDIIIITSAQVVEVSGKPGSVTTEDKQLIVFCGKEALSLLTLKPAGKKEMTAAAFLAGYRHLL